MKISHYMSGADWEPGSKKPDAKKAKGKIKIKKSHKGLFTKKAKAAGESVPGYAQEVLAPGSKAGAVTKKQAQFAANARKWR